MSATRDQNVTMQEFSDTVHALIGIAATTTCALFTAQRPFRIDAVEIVSDTTIASSGTNFYSFNLRVGGRSVATFTNNGTAVTTDTAQAFTMVAETGQSPVDTRVAAKGELVDLVSTLTGSLTINCRIIIHGRYVG
jgi:hypothetical protein